MSGCPPSSSTLEKLFTIVVNDLPLIALWYKHWPTYITNGQIDNWDQGTLHTRFHFVIVNLCGHWLLILSMKLVKTLHAKAITCTNISKQLSHLSISASSWGLGKSPVLHWKTKISTACSINSRLRALFMSGLLCWNISILQIGELIAALAECRNWKQWQNLPRFLSFCQIANFVFFVFLSNCKLVSEPAACRGWKLWRNLPVRGEMFLFCLVLFVFFVVFVSFCQFQSVTFCWKLGRNLRPQTK